MCAKRDSALVELDRMKKIQAEQGLRGHRDSGDTVIVEVETFSTLLRDKAHWEFECFLMLLFDGCSPDWSGRSSRGIGHTTLTATSGKGFTMSSILTPEHQTKSLRSFRESRISVRPQTLDGKHRSADRIRRRPVVTQLEWT